MRLVEQISYHTWIQSYLFVDKNESRPELQSEIEAVFRKQLGNRSNGFQVIRRPTNYGLKKNLSDGLSFASERHDTVLVLEDDIMMTENFVEMLITDILPDYYDSLEDEAIKVAQLSFWSFGREMELNFQLTKHAHCWGWLLNSETWREFKLLEKQGLCSLTSVSVTEFLDITSNLRNHSPALQIIRNLVGTKQTWAIFWSVFIIRMNYRVLTPSFPLIYNDGLRSGENYSTSKLFSYDDYTLDDVRRITFAAKPEVILKPFNGYDKMVALKMQKWFSVFFNVLAFLFIKSVHVYLKIRSLKKSDIGKSTV